MAFINKENIEENDYQAPGEARTLLTISGDNAKIEGKFVVSKSIEIDCEVSGELEIDGELVIKKDGHVNADVKTITAQVIGKYEGNMEAADSVEIKENGLVNGNIKTDSLIINKGGIFSGNVTRINAKQIEPEAEQEEPEPAEEDEDEVNLDDQQDDYSQDLEI
ncbi:MAG: polymer-forming cytoskeletal protein [Actinomycetota bacterium]|jgi:cytoskeletal protein CcmA (bactofilin family)|nr:polymer-forming cytoskeletal protein [Actinomycetota bacterium]